MASTVIPNPPAIEMQQRQRANTLTSDPISLHDAVRDNNIEAVQACLALDGNAGINDPDEHDFAPIHYAAKFNCYRILVLLVENGAKPNLKTEVEGLTPLHLAARYHPHSSGSGTASSQLPHQLSSSRASVASLSDAKQEQFSSSKLAVAFLRDRMADVNVPDKYSNTPLHMACQRGNVDAVQELLMSKDVNLTARNKNERNTPLHEACLHGNSKIVKILLEKLNSDSNSGFKEWVLQNKACQTPLHLACREDHCKIVKLLFEYMPQKTKTKMLTTLDNEGNTALHLACEKGNVEMVGFLLKKGADPTLTQLPKRVTPLHLAASLGHVQVVNALLEADVNLVLAEDKSRQTPIHYAVLANDREVLESFKNSLKKEHMMDRMNTPDRDSRTPLLLAAMLGKDAAFQMLLEILPQEEYCVLDRDRKSVLCLAAEHVFNIRIFTSFKKYPDMYEKLVAAPDANLNTPLHIAAEKGNVTIVKYLLNEPNNLAKKNARNADYQTPMHLAAKNGHTEVVKLLLKSNCLCVVEDEDGDTPLHLACTMGHIGVVHVLHGKRMDPDARNYKDHTPLHCAAIGGHDVLVEILIKDFKAEVDPVDRNHFTPLLHAAQAGHLKVVSRLLEHGALVRKRVEGDFNALDLAIDNGHENVAMAIVKSSQWKEALRNCVDSSDSVWNETTPLRKLIRSMPRVAEVVFDKCTRPAENSRADSIDYSVTFDYEFIEDFRDPEIPSTSTVRASLSNLFSNKKGHRTTWGPKIFSRANHPLTLMLENDRTDLLTHPLVSSLLRYKWYRYGRFIYWVDLFLYMIFVIFLTTFALVLPNPESQTCRAVLNGTFDSLPANVCAVENMQSPECGECDLKKANKIFIIVGGIFIIFFSIASLFYNTFLYIRLYKTYIKDWAIIFNFFSSITAVIFAVVHFSHCFCPYNWQWQLGTVAVFLTWVNFCVLFRKLPLTGIYVLMFIKVFYTFCKVIILSFLLVIAFSLGFYMAFHQPLIMAASRSPFSSPARSIVKTMTMIVGEFDYEDIFRLSSLEPEVMLQDIPYFEVATLLWIIFLIVAPILFLNLLTGLAVDDIKRIQEDAALKRLELQILGVLSIEEVVPSKFRNRFMITKECTIKPNKGFRLAEKVRHSVWEEECYDTIKSISKALEQRLRNREGTTTEPMQCGHDSLAEDVASIKRTVDELRSLVEVLSTKPDSIQTPRRTESQPQTLRIQRSTSHTSDVGSVGHFFGD